ncbi:hypothetical protein CC86DRAFT_313181 [Ophiobolus disseminans]|uniref:Large ribosomal subunit protein bL34m n=1 Tax=Ophiobolus disseminans TaxID=1469910 RepID=A0A6A7AHW0_9PLEO|nr:hypothetical protein CC86DRAFT_313181 [Ophiobolus disseminans]
MNAFRCLRLAARPATNASTLLRPTPTRTAAPQHFSSPTQHRLLSILTPRRPMLSRPNPPPGTPSSLLPSTSESPDLMGKISAHPGLGSMQIRCGPRDTYNPSHTVRKRRHGFLSRIRTKKGRKTLMRRLTKGRWNLSH